MANIFNHDWYDRNSVRQYPLDMAATAIDDFENPLNPALLEDVSLYVPENLNVSKVYVGSGHITGTLCSAVFVGSTPDGAVPLCAATVVTRNSRMVSVDALADGVRGWVVLGGPDANAVGRWTFSSPLQSLLAPGCWYAYRRPPVFSLGAANRLNRLAGDVSLQAGGHLELASAVREVRGVPSRVLILRMDPELPADTRASYVAVCANTDGVCSPAPIQTVNKVKPDADGNITIEVKGMPTRALVDFEGRVNGVVMESPLGLIDICDVDKGMELGNIDMVECE
jgi:hypothetical protein